MQEIRWGIIGCGNVTEVKSGPAFQKAQGSRLTAVMRRDGALAEDYARRHGVERWYSDAESLIHDPEVDAVYIATPPAQHLPYTLQVAKAGKPVYVEKPMALHAGECTAMTEACQEAGVPLFVAYYRRALPRFLKVKELLEEGAIGRVHAVNTRHWRRASEQERQGDLPWRLQREVAGGGHFVDLASHTLNLIDYLVGPITAAEGRSSNRGGYYEVEDLVTGFYQTEDGIHGSGQWGYTVGVEEDINEIVGSEGKLVFSTFGELPVVLHRGTELQSWEIAHPAHVQQPLIQTIVDELLGQRGACPSDAASAVRTSRIMDQLLKPLQG
ncbi:Gfo/Idh/MocA family protein [Paenibacillus daejeonensis]|uniref:Gfo/Idh/MocA family protein n=1 Tax=Paenibacillus daejeonensis TaxID=135193 RepID=UPI00035D04CA|nr:Gfo/Idh/MocA family oxidoreductase [Paenibacillus daejeonensis]